MPKKYDADDVLAAQQNFTLFLGYVPWSWQRRRAGDAFVYIAHEQIRAGGAPVGISRYRLAKARGINPRYAAALLAELVEARVLLVVEPGAGRRPTTYRVNPNVGDWVGVTLSEPVAAMRYLEDAWFGRAK